VKIRKFLAYFFVLALTVVFLGGSFSFVNVAYATEVNSITETSSYETTSVTRAEETEWYFRVLNGVTEKRLWSITRGIWLTDWMPL